MSMTGKPRVALVHNVLIHYRVPLFNILAASERLSFDFFFGAVHPRFMGAMCRDERYRPRFRYLVLRGLRLLEYNYFSPSLFFWLLRSHHDAYLAGPLGSPDSFVAFLVAKLLRRPFILWDERWEGSASFASKIVEPIQFLMARTADAIIVPGSRSFDYFLTAVLRRSCRSRLLIVPNASEIKEVDPVSVEAFRQSHGIPRGPEVILYLGRLETEKGVDHLLRGFAMLEDEFRDDVFLLVAGEGRDEERLRHLADVLGLKNLRFTCSYVYEQAACLSLAAVVVLPSVHRTLHSEVWGLVVNEAVSLGKPVVVTKAVGCAEDIVAQFRCGLIVGEGSPIDIYHAIRDILLNPETAALMGRNGLKATNTHFSFEIMADALRNAVWQVLAEKPSTVTTFHRGKAW